MPIFTFVYGDMHAHMIAMPMQLAVMGLVLNEILLAGSTKRRRWVDGWGVGAARILRGDAACDQYLGLGNVHAAERRGAGIRLVAGASLTQSRGTFWERFTRRSMIDFAVYVGSFVAFSFIVAIPYNAWFATAYNSISPWKDGKTPLWAYFDIHGLFLFLIVSLLVWETARWLRSVYVRSLRGTVAGAAGRD